MEFLEFLGILTSISGSIWILWTIAVKYYEKKANKLSFSDIAYVANHGCNSIYMLGNYFGIPMDIMRRRLIILGFKIPGDYNFLPINVPVRDDDPTEEFVRMG